VAPGGAFVVTWFSTLQDGDDNGIFAQSLSSLGAPLGREFQVNSYTAASQAYPAIAMAANGRFVIAWASDGQDGNGLGVFAQRFGEGIVLDIDGNGVIGALTDGLLVLRYLFGFSGAALASAATGSGCMRCDGASLKAYLDGLPPGTLNIDSNPMTDALTDGLLTLRYLFGFTGATLTTGAVGAGCTTRCTAADFIAYLDGLST
jgi:hypothetical protein